MVKKKKSSKRSEAAKKAAAKKARKKNAAKRSEAAKKAAATRKKNAAKKAEAAKKPAATRRKRTLQKRLRRKTPKKLRRCSSDPLQLNCVKFTSDQEHLEKFRAVIVESMFPTRCILTIFVRGSNLTTMPKVISHLHAQHAINQRMQLLLFNGSNASKRTGALINVA